MGKAVREVQIVVTRAGRRWSATVPAVAGVAASALTLDNLFSRIEAGVRTHKRWAPDTAIELVPDYQIGEPDLIAEAQALRALRVEVEENERQLARRTAVAAQKLVNDCGMSTRDAGKVVGVSSQRVQQLVPQGGR